MNPPPEPSTVPSGLSSSRGRWLVAGLLLLGCASTATIWVYWKYRLTPYVPLRKALGVAFPKSSPRAEGGPTRKGPPTLIVSLDLKFPPVPDDPRTTETLLKILKVVRDNHDLAPYQRLEVHLTQRVPERAPVRLKGTWNVRDVLDSDLNGLPKGSVVDPDRRQQ